MFERFSLFRRFWLPFIIMLLFLAGCAKTPESGEPIVFPETTQEAYARTMMEHVESHFPNTIVDGVSVYEIDDGYEAFAYLTLEQEESASTTKDILDGYSQSLADCISAQCPTVMTFELFWMVPPLDIATVTRNYVRENDALIETNAVWDRVFSSVQ